MKRSLRFRIILTLGYLASALVIASSIASSQEIQSIKPEELKKLIENKADLLVVDNQPIRAYP